MQQAYRVLRVVSEAQTIRMVLSSQPDELMLSELITACAAAPTGVDTQGDGIKAIVLDFKSSPAQVAHPVQAADGASPPSEPPPAIVERAREAVWKLAPPVLAVARSTLSPTASVLAHTSDLILAAHDAVLTITDPQCQHDRLTGEQAARLGYVTCSVPSGDIDAEMARMLDMLRDKSAIALRLAKASVRLVLPIGAPLIAPETSGGQQLIAPVETGGNGATLSPASTSSARQRLEALKQVNAFYLDSLMRTEDAQEGLHAFLEKRKAHWKNR